MPKTPGQVNYEAFLMARYPQPSTLRDVYIPWEDVSPEAQRAWDAAAQAVLTMQEEEAPVVMHYGSTMHATHGLCGAASPWVAILPRLVTCAACMALMRPHDRQDVPAQRRE